MGDVKRYMMNENSLMGGMDMFEDDEGEYVLHSDYAALLARVARLEEALREIRDYDSYKHPDESLIVLRDAAIKESNECTACQYAAAMELARMEYALEHCEPKHEHQYQFHLEEARKRVLEVFNG